MHGEIPGEQWGKASGKVQFRKLLLMLLMPMCGIDNSPRTTANQNHGTRRPIPVPIPKRKTVSPPKINKNETRMRRKNKRWSSHEEEILRTAVQSFGPRWKYIWITHHDDFGDRTAVDLKDKWRNMNKNVLH